MNTYQEYEDVICNFESILSDSNLSLKQTFLLLDKKFTEFRIEQKKPKTINKIVEDYFGLEDDSLRLKTRELEIRGASQITMYFYKEYFGNVKSLKSIAKEFSTPIHEFDHTTVLHSIKVVRNYRETEGGCKFKVNEIDFLVSQHYRKPIQNLES
jgi:chromosomal replication initiation ATPase DnaA